MESKSLSINFITNYDINVGSTRIRVLNLIEELTKYFDTVKINSEIKDSDIIIFQKTINYKLLYEAIKLHKFICFDIDDLIEDFYEILPFVDMVITSTEYLKQKLLQFNKNIIVIQNCLDIDDYNIPIKKETGKGVVWYGWSHNSLILDKLNIRHFVTTISDNGDIPYDRSSIDKTLQQFEFLIVPQEKNEKTLSKTHCRILKALYLGIPVFFSDLPEYVSLANTLHIPEHYIIRNINKFKEIVENPEIYCYCDIDFKVIRKLILNFYSKQTIAKLLSTKLHNNYKEHVTNNYLLYLLLLKRINIFSIKYKRKENHVYKITKFFGINIKKSKIN